MREVFLGKHILVYPLSQYFYCSITNSNTYLFINIKFRNCRYHLNMNPLSYINIIKIFLNCVKIHFNCVWNSEAYTNIIGIKTEVCSVSVCIYLCMCVCVAAREQLRRSRHSRTFLVESGTGELWSELQTGKAVCVCVCVCTCVFVHERD